MSNIVRQEYQISSIQRVLHMGHKPLLIWFTGLSGSGKSTLANAVEQKLYAAGIKTYTLDGDNVRHGLNKDLGFGPEARTENIRRIAEVANLMLDAGLVVLSAFVSPYLKDRQAIKEVVGNAGFMEVFVDTPLEVCEQRDVKGLYAKARAGQISDFTGISAPYQAPERPDFRVDTSVTGLDDSASMLTELILKRIK
ncbi:adenylyl-sulfate kinase [Flavobacteriaceae bacterium]|nr:adenylyl-sulfate kinase [Flavobacteriaceae bacterium]